MIEYIANNILLSCTIVLTFLLLVSFLTTRWKIKAKQVVESICLGISIVFGILLIFSIGYTSYPNWNIGWTILLALVSGPIVGIVIYGIRYAIICLWIEIQYKIFHK